MTSLMVICTTPFQTVSTETPSFSLVYTGGSGVNHVRWRPTRVPWERDLVRLLDREAGPLYLHCWEFVVRCVAGHCPAGTTYQSQPAPVAKLQSKQFGYSINLLSNYRKCEQGLYAVRTICLSKPLWPIWRQYDTRRYGLQTQASPLAHSATATLRP